MSDERDDLVNRVWRQLRECEGWDGDAIALERKKAEDYYYQRARGDEVVGRSAVVSGDVSAMVEANVAQTIDAFDSDAIAEFDANGPEDADQAKLESYAVTYFVMSQGNGFLELTSAVKDAYLLRNGICKIHVETLTESHTKSINNVKPEALAALTNVPSVAVKVLQYDPKTLELRIRTTRTRKQFRFGAVPLENFLYPKNHDSTYVQDMPFCAERHIDTRSDLLKRGFPKKVVNRMRAITTDKEAGASRNPRRDASLARATIDKSTDLLEWFESYAQVDRGDGVSELHRISVPSPGAGGGDVLEDVPVSMAPYANGITILSPHRFIGISQYDKLKQVQDLTTGLERGLMDNVNTVNKNRVAYLDGRVNVDDVSDGRTNGAIRVRRAVADVRAAVMPFTIPDQSGGILQNIQHMRARRSELGGAALDLATGQMQLNERVGSEGLDRAYSVMEQLAAMMTKICAATLIRSVYLIAHAQLREHINEPVPVKVGGRWITPIPSQWPERRCVTVKVGMSPGERSRRVQFHDAIASKQLALTERGMEDILVNVDGFYTNLMDWARAGDVPHPEQYFIDPRSEPSLQAQQQKRAQQARGAEMQEQLMRQAIQLEQIGRALEKYRADQDTQFKYFEAVLEAEVAEGKIAGDAVVRLLTAARAAREATNGAQANGGDGPGTGAVARGESTTGGDA